MPHVSEFHALPHDRHDRLVVAALAAGDLAGTDRDRARTLLAACPDCAALHTDLLAIARATAALPAAARSRDFRISPEQAARLRPGGWRRLVAAFASPRLALTKPLGVGLTTLGLAGILVSNVGVPFGGAGAASASIEVDRNAAAASQLAISASGDQPAPGGPGASAAAAPEIDPGASPLAGGDNKTQDITGQGPTEVYGTGQVDAGDVPVPTGPSPVTWLSIGAVLLGLALLVVRRVGRRVNGT